jgi:hypothetical protein
MFGGLSPPLIWGEPTFNMGQPMFNMAKAMFNMREGGKNMTIGMFWRAEVTFEAKIRKFARIVLCHARFLI